MPGCVRNSSVYWEPGRKFHSWCHCSEIQGSSSVDWWTDLSQGTKVKCQTCSMPSTDLRFVFAHLFLMMKVFLSSGASQVFLLASGPPLLAFSASFFSLVFSADEQWELEQHFPVLWQTGLSSGLEKVSAEKRWTAKWKKKKKHDGQHQTWAFVRKTLSYYCT